MTAKHIGRGRVLALLALAGLLALAAAWHFWPRGSSADARPALWRIEKGDRQAWLFGTIHAVPGDARWMTPAIEDAIRRSDWLWLEVTGLDDERGNLAIFDRLGRAPALPPLAARLDRQNRNRLSRLAGRDRALAHGLDGYESWAAALLINARSSAGGGYSSRGAGEAVLASAFGAAGKPSAGLETIAGQLGFFDRLPETAQRALLAQAIRDAGTSEQDMAQLYACWAKGDMDALARLFADGLGQQAALKSMLVDRRNTRWAAQIDAIMARHRATPFIAVGAGHLAGPDNLRDLLRTRGWKIIRIQ